MKRAEYKISCIHCKKMRRAGQGKEDLFNLFAIFIFMCPAWTYPKYVSIIFDYMATYLKGNSGDIMNLPQFNGHFKKYTESYTIEKKGVSDEKTEAVV